MNRFALPVEISSVLHVHKVEHKLSSSCSDRL